MTTSEFSNQFDVLYNNISSNQAPGLDEYEKSVFLTKAQEELVKAYFNPKENKVQEGFDGSQRRQYDFSSLISTVVLENLSNKAYIIDSLLNTNIKDSIISIDNRSGRFAAPSDYFLSINELITDYDNVRFVVIPITYSEYAKYMSKPYAYPAKRQAWRLISNSDNSISSYAIYNGNSESDGRIMVVKNISQLPIYITVNFGSEEKAPTVEVKNNIAYITFQLTSTASGYTHYFSTYLNKPTGELAKYIAPVTKPTGIFPSASVYETMTLAAKGINDADMVFEVILRNTTNSSLTYKMRYVRRPKPIILESLEGQSLTINGEYKASTSELPEACHEEILQRAVELAKATYTGGLQEQLAVGNQSATDKGFVAQQSR